MRKLVRVLWIACGTLCVAVGVVGIFVPLLPTTVFLLLAAICYARSSERLYHRLLNDRWLGEYIKNYRAGRGMPLRAKVVTLLALWLTIGFTARFGVSAWWGRLALLGVAVGVTIHLVRIKTFRRDASAPLVRRTLSSEEPR